MPPLSLTSNSLHSHALLTRSLAARWHPKRHLLASLVNFISHSRYLHDLLKLFNATVSWIHKQHNQNTEKAQAGLDNEYMGFHEEEFEKKHSNAWNRAVRVLARKKPFLFAKGFILDEPKGSMERLQNNALLKQYNPEFYYRYQEILGEALDPGKAAGNDEVDLENIDVSDVDEVVDEVVDE